MELPRSNRIKAKVELILPPELEAGLTQRVIAELGAGVALGKVGGVSGNLVGDHTVLHILFVRESEMLLGGYVAEHGTAIPADHSGADAAGDVVVAWGDVGGEGAERVERGLVAPLELLGHVLFDHVHRDMARTLVHDLDPFGPGSLGELALNLEFAELGLVVGIGHGTGTEAVADGEADVVGGHDVADIIPVRVEEILLVMGETPLRHDGATAADDAGHALGGERDEAKEDAGVDREVINSLLGLLDECVTEDLPGEVLGLAIHFFQSLVDRDGADRDGGVTQDPFAGGMDVLAGGEIHDGIASPLGGPAHLLDFFLDRGSDGAVPDVGVDLH